MGDEALDLMVLVLTYVAERWSKGELNERSAQVVRSHLLNFAASTRARPANVTRRTVETWMARPGLAPSYRRSRLSSLRGFCQWCVLAGHMPKDPTLGLRAPRQPRLTPRHLTETEVAAILRACGGDPRDRLIVLLMVQEGLRRIEVARAQLGDVNAPAETIDVRGKGGHGEITRVLPASPQTLRAVDDYVIGERGSTGGPLIRSRRNPAVGVSAATVGERVQRVMEAAGVKRAAGDGRSAHALRHTMATDMVLRGAELPQVRDALGHASVKTTEWYVRVQPPGLRDAMGGRRYG